MRRYLLLFVVFFGALVPTAAMSAEYIPFYRYGYLKTESLIKSETTQNDVGYNELGLTIASGVSGINLGIQHWKDPQQSYKDADLDVNVQSETYLLSPEVYLHFGIFGASVKPYLLSKYGYEDITLNVVKDQQKVDLSTLQSIGPFFGYGFLIEYPLGPIVLGLGSAQFDFTKETSISGTQLKKTYISETYLSISINTKGSGSSGPGHKSGKPKNLDPCRAFNAC